MNRLRNLLNFQLISCRLSHGHALWDTCRDGKIIGSMDGTIFHWLTYLLHVAFAKHQELLQSQARNGSFWKNRPDARIFAICPTGYRVNYFSGVVYITMLSLERNLTGRNLYRNYVCYWGTRLLRCFLCSLLCSDCLILSSETRRAIRYILILACLVTTFTIFHLTTYRIATSIRPEIERRHISNWKNWKFQLRRYYRERATSCWTNYKSWNDQCQGSSNRASGQFGRINKVQESEILGRIHSSQFPDSRLCRAP